MTWEQNVAKWGREPAERIRAMVEVGMRLPRMSRQETEDYMWRSQRIQRLAPFGLGGLRLGFV